MDLHTLDAGVHLVTTVVAGGIFVSQVDDLQVDAQYFVRGLHRRSRASDSIALREALRTVPQKRIAILVPAWKEAGVIQQMLEHNVAALDYDGDKYDFFCGTYPNDLETQRKVDAAARVASNVHKIVLPHDGPTSKADCLNWVYQGVVLLEHRRGERFDILLMHDAEDLITRSRCGSTAPSSLATSSSRHQCSRSRSRTGRSWRRRTSTNSPSTT